MISIDTLGKTAGAVLIAGWAVWTELRLRQAQSQTVVDKLTIKDDAIEKYINALSVDDLNHDLDKELGSSEKPTYKD